MITCTKCGFQENDTSAKFCKECGAELNSQSGKKVTVHSRKELVELVQKEIESHISDAVLDLNFIDISEVTDLQDVFTYSKFKGQLDISRWDVSKVTNMNHMFLGTSFDTDLSSWDVSSVRDMGMMFDEATGKITGLSRWDVGNVTNMHAMFAGTTNMNEDLSSWNVSRVTNMKSMFEKSIFNQDIGSWDVSSVKDMSSMFEGSKFNHDIGNWNTSSVVNLSRMFKHCPFTTEDLSKWKLDSLIKFEDFGSSRNIKTTGWSEQLKNRKIINLEKIEDLEQLKGVVLFGFLDKTE